MEQLTTPEPRRDYEPIQPQSGLRDLLRKIWAPIGGAGLLIAKYGVVLFKFKFLFSIFVSAAIYVWIGGWWFGIGLVVLLFVHEMGHVLEAKRQGLPVTAPLFIPFMGAVIGMKRMPQDAYHEALNGIAGPILGSLGAAVLWLIGWQLDSRPLIALAFLGFLINLFNLIPIVPLDGGRITAAIHPALWGLGVVALAALCVLRPNPLLIVILLVSSMELWQRWKTRGHPENEGYYRVTPRRRLGIAFAYFALAALLVVGMHYTHVPRDF
jgi:Zn-dependent protease